MQRRHTLAIIAMLLAAPSISLAQPPGGGRGPGPGGPGPGGRGPGGSPLDMLERMFDQIDADMDGSITKAELKVAMQNERRGMGRRGEDLPPRNRRDGDQARRRPTRGGDSGEFRDRGNRGNRGRSDGGGERRGPGGPPPQPGQVLPDFVADSLSLTADQKDQLAKLQSDVDQRLASILTEQQKQQIEEHHRRGPHSEGERRTRPNRPQ